MIGIAVMIAIAEARADFAQIACRDRLAAHYAYTSRTGRPAVYKYESHVAPPKAKQNTRSALLGNKGLHGLLKAQPPCSDIVKLQIALRLFPQDA